MSELDVLAAGCSDISFEGVIRHMRALGFSGDRDNYYDARNSYLNHVIDRRRGIPITLSVVAIELGRRLGVPVIGIGMPGHFLVRDGAQLDAFADVFDGRMLDRAGCERLFDELQPGATFDDSLLAPAGTRSIVARLLANLKGIHLARRDRRSLAWVLRLRIAVPGVPLTEHRELASALAADGQFLEAAAVLDALAELARGAGDLEIVDDAERGADRLRARLN
jgi:regulator of sirC expression with transglutaminase-like and TPR domain